MRPEEQELLPSLTKISEGIAEFRLAVVERMESGDWKSEHIRDIDALSLDLLKYQNRIINLKKENW